MSSPIERSRTASVGRVEQNQPPLAGAAGGQGEASRASVSGVLSGARQAQAPVLAPAPAAFEFMPDSIERRETGQILTSVGLRALAGNPKPNRKILWLFPSRTQRSQEYRRVLSSVETFERVRASVNQPVTLESVDQALTQLNEIRTHAQAYVDGRWVLSRKNEMRRLVTDVDQESQALLRLRASLQQGLAIPPDQSLDTLLPYVRRGLTADLAIQCLRDGSTAEDMGALVADGLNHIVPLASWVLSRANLELDWGNTEVRDYLEAVDALFQRGVTRDELESLDVVFGEALDSDAVFERVYMLVTAFSDLAEDEQAPPGIALQLLNAARAGYAPIIEQTSGDELGRLLASLIPEAVANPKLPQLLEAGLSVGLPPSAVVNWMSNAPGVEPSAATALASVTAKIGRLGPTDGASVARWQSLADRFRTDEPYRNRVRDITLGLGRASFEEALLFADHNYSDEEIVVWKESNTVVSDVLMATPFRADQVQGSPKRLGAGAFNTVWMMRWGNDPASAQAYAVKPLSALDEAGISLQVAGVPRDNPQVLARNMASAELARRLNVPGLIPESRPGFYHDEGGELRLGVVMQLASSPLPDKKTLVVEEDISHEKAAKMFLDSTSKLVTANTALLSMEMVAKLRRQQRTAFDALRELYPELKTPSDLKILSVNGTLRLRAPVGYDYIPDPSRADPALQAAFMGLQMLDYLLLQVDRHMGNFMIQRDTKGNTLGLVGFDNDQCLGSVTDANALNRLAPRLPNGKQGKGHFLGMPPLLSTNQIDAFMQLNPSEFQEWLTIAGFDQSVRDALMHRWMALRSALQNAKALATAPADAPGVREVSAYDDQSRNWILGRGRKGLARHLRYDNSLWRLNRTGAFTRLHLAAYKAM